MSSTPEDALAWAIRQMQDHAAELRKLVQESFTTRSVLPANHLNSILLTIEELADELEKVSITCTESLPGAATHNCATASLSEDEALALELELLPSPEHVSLQEHFESMGIDYDSDQSRGC
jgi:hypothetical protein